MAYLYLSIGGAVVGLIGLFLTRFVKDDEPPTQSAAPKRSR